ncbi:MAG: hypothetical protein LBL90_10245 [Prevotellaceae bacterium]|jgi:hypothetical protein|nr:hypothetical protein [Prevotellaceae bacterium]
MAKPKPKTQADKPVKSFPFFIIGLIFIALSLFLSFAPGVTRAWGLNYIRFFAPWAVLFYIVLLCFCLPPTNKCIVKFLGSINKKVIISVLVKYKYLLFVVISIAFGFIFYLLKTKYIFLGDLDLRPKQIEQGQIIKEEYFTMLLFKRLHSFLNNKFGFTGIQTVQLADYVLGGIFIFVSLCIANLIGSTFLKKLSVFVASTLSLTILLQFCGYTEIYALPVLFLLLYLFACILHLKKGISIIVPVFTLLVGIAFHLMLACMLPSLIFLFYRSVLWKYPLFRKKSTILILILVFLPFIYIAYKKYAIPMVLPMSDGEKKLMTMFSSAHFKEFINSQLLASGIGFFIWLAILVYSLVNKLKYDVIHWFLLISSLSIVGLMFVFDPHRGSGDWDILAFAAVVYNLCNACVLLMLHEKKLCRNIKYGILMISGFSVIHTSMWLATNKTDASIGWLECAFEDDPGRYYKTSFNNEAMLNAAFAANNLNDLALKWGRKAYLKHRNDPRGGYNYANELIRIGQDKEAAVILEELTRTFPFYPLSYTLLISYYIKIENYNSLYNLLERMESAYLKNPEAFTNRLPQEQLNGYFTILHDFRRQIQQRQK